MEFPDLVQVKEKALYQALDFLRDSFPTSPLQQHYQIKGFCIDKPYAMLQPGEQIQLIVIMGMI